ncbi:uncharacterized protein [Littorina saxatilis]|uniref:DUF4832 domain-containing protein n=1 Tax=Littorina saxatilis TaxID=31220 RepID=A0AAN9BZB5_9CAEN
MFLVISVVIHLLLGAGTSKPTSCGSCVNPNSVPSTFTVKTYSDSSEDLENPHRGFAEQIVTWSHNHVPLTKSQLDGLRQSTGITVVLRHFVLDTFLNSPISDDFLNKIRHDLDVIDSASFTVVLRFCYTFAFNNHPPYGDARKNIVLQHINQLKPIFHQYERITTSMEAGFIGIWGEWFYTDYFGMPSPWSHAPYYDPMTLLTPQALRDRKDVLVALLNAAPKSVQVQTRHPSYKMYMMGTTPTTLQDVQSQSDRARTGHHNDCFLSSDNDVGTYVNKTVEYPFLNKDTRYCIIGGETCRLTTNDRDKCPTATKTMAMFHWTWLNEAYNQDMYKIWKQEGCYPEVHRRLGYRLTITKAILPKSARVSDTMCFHLEFNNTGYAAPMKHFKLYFILENVSGSQHYAAQVTGVDVRDWQHGYTHTVASSVHLTHVPRGQYKVLVSLSDPLMGDRADYNVLLATTGVPLYTQGLNDLGHTVTVSDYHPVTSHCPPLTPWRPPTSGHYSRLFRGPYQ